MALHEKNSSGAPAETDRGVCLRPASFLAIGIVFIAAVALAYVGGVMSGRALVENAPCVPVAHDNGRNMCPGSGEEGDKGRKDNGILSAEELDFSRALRSDGQTRPRQDKQPPAQASVQAGKPQKTGGADSSAAGKSPQAPFAPAVPPGVAQPPAPPAAMHDYVFQVAALKSEDSVDALRQRLEGRGLRTRMKREGKLLLVLVLLRGDKERAAEVTQTVESMHLGRPILVSRKPVMP